MGPGHYHKMETKPIGQGARSASGRRHDLDLSVVATRQLCPSPRRDPWLAALESPPRQRADHGTALALRS
jgi:hypothetical protein